jgi:hypothetical protein
LACPNSAVPINKYSVSDARNAAHKSRDIVPVFVNKWHLALASNTLWHALYLVLGLAIFFVLENASKVGSTSLNCDGARKMSKNWREHFFVNFVLPRRYVK